MSGNFPLDNKKILIIDDARPPRKVLKKLLGDLGRITFFEAETIKIAKPIMEKESLSLIFCDHHLPDGTSTTLLSWLKKNEHIKNYDTPIFVVSSDLKKETIIIDRNLGAVNFLVKPFNFSDLLQVLSVGLNWNDEIIRTCQNKF